jgi:hypothetical protein
VATLLQFWTEPPFWHKKPKLWHSSLSRPLWRVWTLVADTQCDRVSSWKKSPKVKPNPFFVIWDTSFNRGKSSPIFGLLL